MATVSDELGRILEALDADFIDVSEAARRAHLLEVEPGRYHCGTCRFFKADTCCAPGHPLRKEHPLSVRCGLYEYRDPRDDAMPVAAKRGSKMFK